MEGILQPLPWTIPRTSFYVPHVARAVIWVPGGSFKDFPEQNGYTRVDNAADLIRWCDSYRSLSEFAQSWLFFKLLSTFLGYDVNQYDFVTNGVLDLSKDAAHQHFIHWRAGIGSLSFRHRQQTRTKFHALVNVAHEKSEIFEEAGDLLGVEDSDFDKVFWSIKLLISLLYAVVEDTFSLIDPKPSAVWSSGFRRFCSKIPVVSGRYKPMYWMKHLGNEQHHERQAMMRMEDEEAARHFHRQFDAFRPIPPGTTHYGRSARCLMDQFVHNGWCPYRALQLCRSYDYLALNSFAMLVNVAATTENHEACLNKGKCCAHDINNGNPEAYPFRHATDECFDCGFVSAPTDEVCNIIRSGNIPIISVNIEGDFDLKVIPWTPALNYTTISHVWSDGLGNPKSNSLLSCQLSRLRELIYQSYFAENNPFYDGSSMKSILRSNLNWAAAKHTRLRNVSNEIDKKRVFFWMDTLCIPITDGSLSQEEAKDLKFRALKHITPVFAGAHNTLVLEEGLQTTTCSNPSRVSGDEFAALVLASKWSSRGWTLEEGSLSSSCAFQIAGKQFEVTASLDHWLPNAGASLSPLHRSSMSARRWITTVLKREMLQEKNSLNSTGSVGRAKQMSNMMRVPQFVWIWNALLDRSLTKEYDGPLILANLLDFNVFPLKALSHEERLRLLIESCDELPLSILYNTGPRVFVNGSPEVGWIPKNIAGDQLVLGGTLRRGKGKSNEGFVTYSIDRSLSKDESLLVLEVQGLCIPFDVTTFQLRVRDVNGGEGQIYIIEVKNSTSQDPTDQIGSRDVFGRLTKTFLVIDLACGTNSRAGIAGKGARLYADSSQLEHTALKYDGPITVRTSEQWQWQQSQVSTSISHFEAIIVDKRKKLFLKHNSPYEQRRLVQRPMGSKIPRSAKYISFAMFLPLLVLLIIALHYAWYKFRRHFRLGLWWNVLPIPYILTYILGPFILFMTYYSITKRLAIRYRTQWLKSFNDEPTEHSTIETPASRFFKASYARIACLLRPSAATDTTQSDIDLLTIDDIENNRPDLPGEVYLE